MDGRGPTWPPRELSLDGMTVRAYRPGDGARLARAVEESYDHLSPWMPWARRSVTPDDSEKTVAELVRKYDAREDFTLAVVDGDDLVGSTGFHIRVGSLESRNAEIGMWIHVRMSGQGLGTRLLNALLAWGFGDWGFERLVWRCDPLNVASARVAEKCGMVFEGTARRDLRLPDGERRDSRVYSMLATERERARRTGSLTSPDSGRVVRDARPSDAESIARIYNEGIEDRVATFETTERTPADVQRWFDSPLPKVVVEDDGTMVAFAAAFSYSLRPCYQGVAEFSVYVRRDARGSGAGTTALEGLIAASRLHGLHKLTSRVFPENQASLNLMRRAGFREVGVHRSHSRLDGVWRDCVCVELLITENL